MTILHREPAGPVEMALYGLLALSLVTVLVTGIRLAADAPIPADSRTAGELSPPTLGDRRPDLSWSAVRVVQRDPFHLDRRAPAARYLLPEGDSGGSVSVAGPLREGAIRLLGTAVLAGGGGFVMCQVGSATPEVVRVGEDIGGLTLRTISRGAAEFTRRDGTVVTLRVPSATPGLGREGSGR